MKRKNGKKVRKIVLLVILAIVAGESPYTTWCFAGRYTRPYRNRRRAMSS